MRHQHPILTRPLNVPGGRRLKVLKRRASRQREMGEALTIDTIVGSIDAEVIAIGPSAKGPNRGAIVRHGPYTLWSFAGGPDAMTPAGVALFVNTVAYAARQRGASVLERRRNHTRDGIHASLAFVRKRPGYLRTMKRLYLPGELRAATVDEVERWAIANRPYLRVSGRRFEVDVLAREMAIPNHSRAFLRRCVENLLANRRATESAAALRRYTGQAFGADGRAWQAWYRANEDYLFFSDCEGFRFKVDEEAKRKQVPTEKLRGWSSEKIDYRIDRIGAQPGDDE